MRVTPMSNLGCAIYASEIRDRTDTVPWLVEKLQLAA
jgi:hypothetical protein